MRAIALALGCGTALALAPAAAAGGGDDAGQALQLDGKSALTLPVQEALQGLRQFTAECWVRGPLPSRAAVLFGNLEGAGLGIMWADKAQAFPHGLVALQKKGYLKPRAVKPWDYAAWTHLAVSYDGRFARLWVGGELAGEEEHVALPNHSTRPFFLGADPDSKGKPNRFFRGAVDEFRLSSVARYGKRFRPKRRFKPDRRTLALYHFDERLPDGNHPDASKHARHAVPHGAPALAALDAALPGAVTATLRLGAEDAALRARADTAVQRAARWLAKAQQFDGSWEIHGENPRHNGMTALAVYALLSSGSTRFDEPVKRGMAFLLERWKDEAGSEEQRKVWRTYGVSCALLALEALAKTSPKSARSTVAGANGLLPAEQSMAKQLQVALLEYAGGVGGTGNGMGPIYWAYPDGYADNSCTQMAVLGLRAAERLGIHAEARVWRGILQHFLKEQEPDGPKVRRIGLDPAALGRKEFVPVELGTNIDRARGWGYHLRAFGGGVPGAKSPPRGSMTCAAVACLAIAREQLIERANGGDLDARRALDKHTDDYWRSLHDGFAWLQANYSVTGNPPTHGWHYYYLYGLERAGVLCGREQIGRRDWYRDGAELILSQQSKDGRWASGWKNNGQ
ncbi:MAG: LamG-like jellyroll fold domain-containing protein, partial [Planctomycetota bacterium]